MTKPAEDSDKKHGDPLESAIENMGSGSKRGGERKEKETDEDELNEDDEAFDNLEDDDSEE